MGIEELVKQLTLLFIAFGANFLSAFAGGGAGLVQLPALILIGLPFSTALATHKLASVALGLGAGLRHAQEKNLKNYLIILILGFGLPGVWLGARIALAIPSQLGTIILGFFTFGIGIYSIKSPDLGLNSQLIRISSFKFLIGGGGLFLIGILNGSLSSGTGLLVTLWLVRWFGLSYSQAVGYTLILVGLFWNGTGAFVLGVKGDIQWEWLPMLIVGSFLGGYAGAQVSISKGNQVVKGAFETLSLLMGASLLMRGML
ncbi:sulfite exporter TauE/SafE family protein [Prochlorococcus sp. MIT 1307]|uniref:sulfite exporter TauE/SafE family protein n=1 Tax=Prochlorococcus sp. MIT 1307 TaxID=3096219 RepID=UPI002A755E28|nr:sulfite exporter TauE/SafE family protein [Prochlorococcus sp. MIT 1307]